MAYENLLYALLNQGCRRRLSAKRKLRPNTLNDWNKKYKSKGVKGLHSESVERVLRTENHYHPVERQIQKMIIDKMPDQLKT
ncbi:MAG: hypothetical protein M9887_08315 [Chitinophagales bacterium]|nr:hypothetical protein [Chitinophagales bacterium]